MIVPWIKGFQNWHQAPMTWTLILLNFFIFLQTQEITSRRSGKAFVTNQNIVLTGKLYDQYKDKDNGPAFKDRTETEWIILGGQALKDPRFIAEASSFQFAGDEVAIAAWKKDLREYQSDLKLRSVTIFGLRSQDASPLNWVTYQFMHGSWMHLISNMLMLLIFGAALEMTIGSVAMISVYVMGGLAGAAMYLVLGQSSMASVVGASGALSAIMAFYAAYEKKKRVSFFYFVSPVQGYWGWIYLPTLLIFPLSFLSDIAGYLSTPAELGTGVAYTAHIGGALFGALGGFALRHFRKTIWVRWISQH